MPKVTCPVCSKSFSSERGMRIHRKLAHRAVEAAPQTVSAPASLADLAVRALKLGFTVRFDAATNTLTVSE